MRLRLHYKHTHEAYYKAKDQWNQQCKKKYTKEEVRTDKKGRTYVWREYRAHLLKGEHDRTFIALTQAFQVYCDNLIKFNHNEDKPFFTYIKSIATMVDKDESTINRHLHRLQDAGIITDWFSYGLKNSVSIGINQNILHAEPTGNICEILVYNYENNVNNCRFDIENNPISDKEYVFLKRSFTDCYALSLAFCKRFEVKQDTKKINNMISGKQPTINPLLNSASGTQEPFKQEQGRITQKKVIKNEENNAASSKTEVEQHKDRYGRQMSFFVTLAINFMMRVLYKNRTFLPNEMMIAREKIVEIFTNTQSYQSRLDDFNEIILSKQNYNERHPYWVEKKPSQYLSKNNPNGFFRNQEFFYNVTMPQRKKNEKHYLNRRLFTECFRMYAEDQNNYYKIAQLLGKKQKNRDEKVRWLDIFNERFVINREKLSQQIFTEIHHQHYGRK